MEVCSQNLLDPKTVLLKVNGNKCNMRCVYCSELSKSFTQNQCTYNFEKINKILERLPKNTEIILHGGEPTLLGVDKTSQLIKKINELKFQYVPSIQTNGYLTDDWLDFFDRNRELVNISISIDGDIICNSFRQDLHHNSTNAFEKVNRFIHNIDSEKIKFRCIATINSRSFSQGDRILNYFTKFENLKFLKLNPCFDIDVNGVKSWAIKPSQYLYCLKTVFNLMLQNQCYKKFKVDPLMDIINDLSFGCNKFEFKCNKFVSIFPDGTITSCDAMREIEQNLIICDDMFNKLIQPNYVQDIIKNCQACENIRLCKGGCPALLHRYKLYAPQLVSEYCNYRVELRKYIKIQLGL